MRLLLLSVLVLIVFFTNVINADRYVSMENSRYRPYENLFNKKPKLNFRKTYYNRYISKSVHQINKNSPKVNVCFKNVITIDDPLLKGYDPIYKDSRIIAEYLFSKISKYTSLKFYLTTRNCDMDLDFDHPFQQNYLGWTTFYVEKGKPQATVQIDRMQIKNYAQSARISYLRAYMQVLMHEILHGLGLGHSEDDLNSKSMIRAVYDGTNQQLLYKKDVYNLRSIYGARRRQVAPSNGTTIEFGYPDPTEWDDLVLRNMEDNSPEIAKEVSPTTNNSIKNKTNKPSVATGAIELVDPLPVETSSKSNKSNEKPSKTTTKNPFETKKGRSDKTTTERPVISESDLQKEFSRGKYLLTTKRSVESSTYKPSITTRKPVKTTTEKLTEISEADLQKEFSRGKYLLTTKRTVESSTYKPYITTRKQIKTTTEKLPDISDADLQKEFSRVKYLLTTKRSVE